jgi:hypothetical protein
MALYRDSTLGVAVEYPRGWVPDLKKTYSQSATTHHLFFEAPGALWTRRFTVKVIVWDPERRDRVFADYREEYLLKLSEGAGPDGAGLRVQDSGDTRLDGEPAYRAAYTTFRGAEPDLRILDIIARHRGLDYGITFEVAATRAEQDILLFEKVATRFRFYTP